MLFKEASSKRIIELCEQFGHSINSAAEKSGIASKTLYDIVNCESNKHNTYIIFLFCKGMGIPMKEFYDSPLFDYNNIIENEISD